MITKAKVNTNQERENEITMMRRKSNDAAFRAKNLVYFIF